jgi:hypothetical protein
MRPSSESDRVGNSAIEGSWLAKANGVDVPPPAGGGRATALAGEPAGKVPLEPQSLSPTPPSC